MAETPAFDKIKKLDAIVEALSEARSTPQFFGRYLSSKEVGAVAIVKQLCEEQIKSLIGVAKSELELRRKLETQKAEMLGMDVFAKSWEAAQNELDDLNFAER